jgi:hypothetical protein
MRLSNLFYKLLFCICVLTILSRASDDEDDGIFNLMNNKGPKQWCWV